MKPTYLFLTTGFEEIEALGTVDILRRADINVKTVSLEKEKEVTASHKITVVADMMFDEVDFSNVELLVIPGGTVRYDESECLKREVLEFAAKGGKIAAICAAPMVLGNLGILDGRKATCYPGFEKYLSGAILETDKAVVVDENIITGKGPGFTFEFALELVEQLAGKAKRDEVASALLLK